MATSNVIFVDASAWVASFFRRDDNYPTAKQIWDDLIAGDWPLATSNWTLYEALTILRAKASYDQARLLWTFVKDNQVEVIDAGSVENEALEVFFKYREQTFSVVDCVNFPIIRNQECSHVFAFDQHFRAASGMFGFSLL